MERSSNWCRSTTAVIPSMPRNKPSLPEIWTRCSPRDAGELIDAADAITDLKTRR
jgi:hypothetical protein